MGNQTINALPNLISLPDFVIGATEESDFRFEERQNFCPSPVLYSYEIKNESAKVIIHPSKSAVKFLKLRWKADMHSVEAIFGDEWERISSTYAPLEWKSIMPYRPLPWFCYLRTKNGIACYGVKTGCNCFAFFQVDESGITLFLNLMSGSRGTLVKEDFVACEITQTFSQTDESAYETACRFMGMLCDKPILPKGPIFGCNNWY